MPRNTITNAMARARKAGLTWRLAVLASLAWGAAMAISGLVGGLWFGRAPGAGLFQIVWLLASGGVLAFAPALLCTRFLIARPSLVRLAVLIVALALATFAFTAALMALEYRQYFAQWHNPFPSRIWVWQQVFTSAGAVYQYAVVGPRLYWPLGPVFLVAFSLWANRLAH